MKLAKSMMIVSLLLTTSIFVGCQVSRATSDGAFVGGYPTPAMADAVMDDADFQRAVVAYRFWYPSVSAEGIFNGNRSIGIADNEGIGIAAAGPRQVGFTLNSDTPYGSGVIDVKDGPMVVELPPGAYIGLINDHHQGWVLDMGLPGPDAGKGGKHLILPPGYNEAEPAGYFVGRSTSYKNLIAVRALPVNGDIQAAMKALREIKIFPLMAADPKPIKVKNLGLPGFVWVSDELRPIGMPA